MKKIIVKKISYIYIAEWQIKGKNGFVFFNDKKDIEVNIKNQTLRMDIFKEIKNLYPEILL